MKTILRILRGFFIAIITIWLISSAPDLFNQYAKYFVPALTLICVTISIVKLFRALPKRFNNTSWLWLILACIGFSQIDADREASYDEDDFIRSKWQ